MCTVLNCAPAILLKSYETLGLLLGIGDIFYPSFLLASPYNTLWEGEGEGEGGGRAEEGAHIWERIHFHC